MNELRPGFALKAFQDNNSKFMEDPSTEPNHYRMKLDAQFIRWFYSATSLAVCSFCFQILSFLKDTTYVPLLKF